MISRKILILALLFSPMSWAIIPPIANFKLSNHSDIPIVDLEGTLQILNNRDQDCVHTENLNQTFEIPIEPRNAHTFVYTYGSTGVCSVRDKSITLILRIGAINRQPFVDESLCEISYEVLQQGRTNHYAGSEIILNYAGGKWNCTKL